MDYLECPKCMASLVDLRCIRCNHLFESTLGIPDLRWPKPVSSDREKKLIENMVRRFDDSSLEELMAIKFQGDETPADLKDHYRNYRKQAYDRGHKMISMFDELVTMLFADPERTLALDVGCGSGASCSALSSRYNQVIGLDPFLPDLLLAKKLFQQEGIRNVTLIQAYGQKMPLPAEKIDFSIGLNLIEHLPDVPGTLSEINRVVKSGGYFCADSRNRFDLFFLEPHSNIRWVGFLPRSLQSLYVQFRKGIPYKGIRLLSLFELHKLATFAFGDSYRITFPHASTYGQSAKWDKLIRLIDSISILRFLALPVFPSHALIAQANHPHVKRNT